MGKKAIIGKWIDSPSFFFLIVPCEDQFLLHYQSNRLLHTFFYIIDITMKQFITFIYAISKTRGQCAYWNNNRGQNFTSHEASEKILFISFYFFLPNVMVEKVLFLGQIFEMEILMDLHVMRTSESKNHIFSIWSVCTCVCVCDCLCVCYHYYSKSNYSRNIKFGILHLYHT